jgi:predicted dehydrogenase
MKEVRVGIIGGGMISHRHMMIYDTIQRRSAELGFTAKVVACCEVRPERLKAWGEKYGFDEKDLYTDYREMLKRDDIDTIDVCVHNNLHTPIAIEVMKAGFDCYCEKPEASSYHDAQMMIDCAKKLGRKYHVQMSSLMTPQTRVARDMIARGELGNPYYVNLEQVTMRRRPGYDAGWLRAFTTDFYSGRMAGHGPSIDLGVYVIGQILFMLGLPKLQSVSGFARQGMELDQRLITNPDGFGVEDICDGFAKFENGVGFHYLATSANNAKEYAMTYILGSKGGLEVTDTDTAGGKFARPAGMDRPAFGEEPNLRFFGKYNGRDVSMDLRCDENGLEEELTDPKSILYNDNQAMWLAYKLGILDDTTRYNTPEVAAQQLLFTDGIFLSEKLGRSVTADEIKANSPSLYLREQEIGSQIVKFDVEF